MKSALGKVMVSYLRTVIYSIQSFRIDLIVIGNHDVNFEMPSIRGDDA